MLGNCTVKGLSSKWMSAATPRPAGGVRFGGGESKLVVMNIPKNSPGAKTSKAGLAGFALARARMALRDPQTKAMLLEQAKVAGTKAKAWQAERQDSTIEVTGAPKRADSAQVEPAGDGNEPVDQAGLEQRVDNLRTSMTALSDGRPDLAEALAPVSESVDMVAISLQVAGGLAGDKRQRAHERIDAALDELENDLFDAALPAADADPATGETDAGSRGND